MRAVHSTFTGLNELLINAMEHENQLLSGKKVLEKSMDDGGIHHGLRGGCGRRI